MVSVIIPVKEIGMYAREAVDHVHRRYPDAEILVVPDHPAQEAALAGVTVVPSWPVTAPGAKRDLAGGLAAGDILAFLDDDAYPDAGWLEAALPHFEDPTVAAVGGPGVTPPSNDHRQRASGWILSSPMGTGWYTYRFRPGKARDVDDFPSMNLLVRKADFEAVGGFKSRYWPGEDSELCRKLGELGKRIVYEPRALVYHHRRPVFRGHLVQQARYGLHRGHFARRFSGNSRRIGYAVPALATVGVVAGALVSAVSPVVRCASRSNRCQRLLPFPWIGDHQTFPFAQAWPMTRDDTTFGAQGAGGGASGAGRCRRYPRLSSEQCSQHVDRSDTMFGCRRYLGVNLGQDLGTTGCSERSGDLQLQFGNLQTGFRLVVRERNAEILGEESYLTLEITKCANEVVGLALKVGALSFLRLRIDSKPRLLNRVEALVERGEHLGRQKLLVGRSGIRGSYLHLDEEIGHGSRPLSLVPYGGYRGQAPREMSSTYPVSGIGVAELHGEPVVVGGALVAGQHASSVDGVDTTSYIGMMGFLRFDGHPPSGARPRKGCPKWRPSNGRNPVPVGRTPRSSRLRSSRHASAATARSARCPGTST